MIRNSVLGEGQLASKFKIKISKILNPSCHKKFAKCHKKNYLILVYLVNLQPPLKHSPPFPPFKPPLIRGDKSFLKVRLGDWTNKFTLKTSPVLSSPRPHPVSIPYPSLCDVLTST